MTTENRAEKEWAGYKMAVYKTDKLNRTQETECKLAFYAGMIICFNEIAKISTEMVDVNVSAHELERFRREIDKAAIFANHDRSDGKS